MTTDHLYNDTSLDEMAGGLLWAGGITAVLTTLLDHTRDRSDYDLLGYIGEHVPDEPAALILTSLSMAVAESRARLSEIGRVLDQAMDNLTERMTRAVEVDDVFDNLIRGVFGDQAKRDGLS